MPLPPPRTTARSATGTAQPSGGVGAGAGAVPAGAATLGRSSGASRPARRPQPPPASGVPVRDIGYIIGVMRNMRDTSVIRDTNTDGRDRAAAQAKVPWGPAIPGNTGGRGGSDVADADAVGEDGGGSGGAAGSMIEVSSPNWRGLLYGEVYGPEEDAQAAVAAKYQPLLTAQSTFEKNARKQQRK